MFLSKDVSSSLPVTIAYYLDDQHVQACNNTHEFKTLTLSFKKIAQKLSDAEQGENLEDYHGTVTVLAKPFILRHSDKDIRFYAACCLANVFRIYAPNAPYDEKQLWVKRKT